MARDGFGITFVEAQEIAPDRAVQIAGLDIVGQVGLVGPRRPPIQATGRALATPAARGITGAGETTASIAPARASMRRTLTRTLRTIRAPRVSAAACAAIRTLSATFHTARTGAAEAAALTVAGAEPALRPLVTALPESTIRPIAGRPGIAAAETSGPVVLSSPRRIRTEPTALTGPAGGAVTVRTTIGPTAIGAPGIISGVSTSLGPGTVPLRPLRGPVSRPTSNVVPFAALTTESPRCAGTSLATGLTAGTPCTAFVPGTPEAVLRSGRIAPERFPAIVLFRHGGSLSR